MITIKLIYDETEKSCQTVESLLKELASEIQFNLETFNVDSTIKKEKLTAMKILVKYGTNKVPFLLFIDNKGSEYGAIYNEHKDFSRERILNLIKRGYLGELPV